MSIQFHANGAHPAVHHVRWRDDVGAGLDLSQCSLRQQRQGGVIINLAVFDEPAMAVTGVFVQTDITDDEQIGHGHFHRPHRALHDTLDLVSAGTNLILAFRNAEQQHGGNAQVIGRVALVDQQVDGPSEIARHGDDFVLTALPGQTKSG